MKNPKQSQIMKDRWIKNRDLMIENCKKGGRNNLLKHPDTKPPDLTGHHWKWAEENRLARSESTKGKHFSPRTEFKSGRISDIKGKTYEQLYGEEKAIEIKNSLRESHKNKPSHRRGISLEEEYGDRAKDIRLKESVSHAGKIEENSSNWQGGLSCQTYPAEFKNNKGAIKQRDKFCRLCGETKGKMCTHHIDYDKKNNDFDNLILLCNSCHMKTNGKRKYWEKLFKIFIGYLEYKNIGAIGI